MVAKLIVEVLTKDPVQLQSALAGSSLERLEQTVLICIGKYRTDSEERSKTEITYEQGITVIRVFWRRRL